MPAPPAVLELVERFRTHRAAYVAPKYNETQVRREFVDPLFKALGWDVDNEQGYAEAYKDVIHEDALKVGQSTRAPDYCFRIGGGRKFFVETKKPSVDLRADPLPAFQLRRYAWSAKLPLSILTDFEELCVYNCRVKPVKTDKAAKERVLYVRYDEYEDRWDEIAAVFSRDAILKGSFDKYAESRTKHGTTEVDDAFLEEIEGWRELLAKNLALRNPQLEQRELNEAVQRTIDRIVFLRIAEDRGIEDANRLQALVNGPHVYQRLCELFEQADVKYNSGLFHFSREPDRDDPDGWTLTLAIDDKPLREIIGHLYYPDSPYEFSVLPADILGQVYERFLGKVIRLTKGHRAVVEEKPEVRKAGGVYYTPTYIVEDIVQNTVGKLVEGRTAFEVANRTQTWKPAKRGRPLSVLDPACGSGTFLIGAYQFLLDWYRDWYATHDPARWLRLASPTITEIPTNDPHATQPDYRLTTTERKRILLDHVFGVDIDPQAVEVTKLSLLLKVLEGENRHTLQRHLFARERALPDLANNVKCGNSLIGPEFYDGRQADLFDEEEMLRVNAFDWEAEFAEAMAPGGFDAVIGNPPYVRIQLLRDTQSEEVDFFSSHYKAAVSGNYDIYVLFVERALRIASPRGAVGFILPHKFFTARYGKGLRELVSNGRRLSQVVDFGDQQVFKGATTYTCLLFLTLQGSDQCSYVHAVDLSAWAAGESLQAGRVAADRLTAGPWQFLIGDEANLYDRLRSHDCCIPLGELADRVFQGFKTGADPVFILERDGSTHFSKALGVEVQLEEAYLRPLFKSGDMKRYNLRPSTRSIIFPYECGELVAWGTLKERAPDTAAYLLECRRQLESRERGRWAGVNWYCYSRTQALEIMEQPKILTADLNPHASFSYDESGLACMTGGAAGGYGVLVSTCNPRYVVALLNSRLLDWYLRTVSSTFRGGWFSYESRFISQLPILTVDEQSRSASSRRDRLVELATHVESLHRNVRTAKAGHARTAIERQIVTAERQIDRIVYELYGLDDDEIRIVEGAQPQ